MIRGLAASTLILSLSTSLSTAFANDSNCQASSSLASETKLAQEKLKIGSAALKEHNNYRVYDIHARTGDDDPYLPEANTLAEHKKRPFQRFRAKPFYYRDDVLAASAKGREPFLVGGINCNATIEKTPTLTGVTLETLSLRARGSATNGQFDGTKRRSEWKGIGQQAMRISAGGFLSRDHAFKDGETATDQAKSSNALRSLFVSDNSIVKKLNLTHQQIAEPIMLAIERHIYEFKDEFEYQGKRYRVKLGGMGGAVDLFTKTKPSKKNLRLTESGWTGRGVQGSFFNDELFSNNVYTIEKIEAGPGEQKSFTIDGLTPHLIHRYGFYQGGEYRQGPDAIAKFFGIKENGSPWGKCE